MVRWAAAWVMAAMVLAGCAGSDPDDAIPIRRPPGTRLDAGFVVPAGSRLVGPVFSIPVRDGGFASVAVMDVDGDPLAVYDAFVAQARRLGVPLPGSGTRSASGLGTCSLAIAARDVPVGKADPARAHGLSCYGAALLPGRDELVVVEMQWGGPSHHAVLEVDPAAPFGSVPDPGTARASKVAPLPAVKDRSSVSEPGAAFGEEHNGFESGYRRFRLEPGSRVVADVAGMTYSSLTVLYCDGEIKQVMDGYARQLGRGGTMPTVQRVRTSDGGAWLVESSPFGGGAASLLSDPSGHWILVRANSD
ncbi:MAG: hypothetical protein JJE46_04345 [Acidimicrobiia bacterium]|nr:hypothetical protein [Acidimicrobiia bacterium]